jgi:hypothetical protein
LGTRRFFSDESGQIVRKLVVFGIIFAVIILIVVEFGPLLWERFDVSQMADDMANAAVNTYNAYHDQAQVVKDVADKLRLAGYTDEEIQQAQVLFLPEGGQVQSIRVTVVKYANTLITRHINALKKYSKISSSHEMGVTQNK